MKSCRKCGIFVNTTGNFCPQCGNKLKENYSGTYGRNKIIILGLATTIFIGSIGFLLNRNTDSVITDNSLVKPLYKVSKSLTKYFSSFLMMEFYEPVKLGTAMYDMNMGGGYTFEGETFNKGDFYTKYKKTSEKFGKGIAKFGDGENSLYIHYDTWNKENKCFIGASDINNCIEVDYYHSSDIYFIETNKKEKIWLFYGHLYGPCNYFWILEKDKNGIFKRNIISDNLKDTVKGDLTVWSMCTLKDNTIIFPFKTFSQKTRTKNNGYLLLKWNDETRSFGIDVIEKLRI